jgi:hypothetical protein
MCQVAHFGPFFRLDRSFYPVLLAEDATASARFCPEHIGFTDVPEQPVREPQAP